MEYSLSEPATKAFRLRKVTAFIEARLDDPLLNLERVANANKMSLRTLHHLFEDMRH